MFTGRVTVTEMDSVIVLLSSAELAGKPCLFEEGKQLL